MHRLLSTLTFALALAGCATTIYPGEVGVRSNFGKIEDRAYTSGIVSHSPFGVRFYRVPIQTRATDFTHTVTSTRGTLLEVEATVVFAARADYAPSLIAQIGPAYERELLDPVFRWATQQVYAESLATSRDNVAERIEDLMNAKLNPRGIFVEDVILERSSLTSDVVYQAFQERMNEEQAADQMRFTLAEERQRSEQRVIEAQGQRDAYDILQGGLTPEVLRLEAIKTFEALATSPNTQVIITRGRTQLILE